MNVSTFLVEHAIVNIGISVPGKTPFAEVIVDSPECLISLLGEHYYISQIMWWDRVLISKGSEIGYGGPRDPRDANNYFFAETDICSQFSCDTKPYEYVNYMDEIKSKYIQYDLYPSFDIAMK